MGHFELMKDCNFPFKTKEKMRCHPPFNIETIRNPSKMAARSSATLKRNVNNVCTHINKTNNKQSTFKNYGLIFFILSIKFLNLTRTTLSGTLDTTEPHQNTVNLEKMLKGSVNLKQNLKPNNKNK